MQNTACSVCGAPLAEGAEFCPVCGNPVWEQVGTEAPRRRPLARVAIAIVLIIALTFGSILTLLVLFAGRSGFSPAAERDFLTACVQGGSPESSCRCALTEIEKRYTASEFAEAMNRFARTNQVPQPFLQALIACGPQPSPTPA
jgi:hypothetical protein